MNLSSQHTALHNKAIARARDHRKTEWAVLEVLQELDETSLYKNAGCSSLFDYAVKYMELDPSNAYPMIKAARFAREIPRLAQSFREQHLTVGKASRIFSALNSGNAEQLVEFAEKHTANEINREAAKVRKSLGLPEKQKAIKLSDDTVSKARRLRSVLKSADLDQAINRALEESLDRHDPVRKAQRAMHRKTARASDPNPNPNPNKWTKIKATGATLKTTRPSEFNYSWTNSVRTETPKRKPLTAQEKHEVFARDGGQCTQIDAQGRRCCNDRYLHIHHIKPVSQGGSNDPSNLTTLCSFHHDLAHQLTLPIEGQITWLRDRIAPYGL